MDAPQTETEQELSETYREELLEKAPSEEVQTDRLRSHKGHLIRDTVSRISESETLGDGNVEMTRSAEVPDTYCFTCEEWVGLSGVELTGTPRSKTDAYYLGGEPEGVSEAREKATTAIAEAASHVLRTHPEIDSVEDAVDFVVETAEQTEFKVNDAE